MLEILKSIGFEETEAKVYIALLQLGPSGASAIARKAGIGHTLCYHALEKLGWFGLVNRSSGQKKRIQFVAKDPKNLKHFVKSKINTWERKEKELESQLPDFYLLYTVAEKPSVRFQEGVEGAKNIYWETLEAKSEILSVLDLQAWYTPEFNLFKWGKEYTRERSKRKISERVLVLDTPEGRDWMKHYQGSKKYINYRWIKPEQVPTIKDLGGEINIYDNKVMMALFKKPIPIGIIIESTALSNILKAIFELAWITATPLAKTSKKKK
ncbi:MAG: helix-turn-helix domain-containing protein [Candidatus Magasanikiibacteriota bacterium]